jgi:hypothetical protein
MPLTFISCYLKVAQVRISQNFATTLLKAQLFSSAVSVFVDSLLPNWTKGKYSRPMKVDLPPLQTLAHGVVQCRVTGIWCHARCLKDQYR